MTNAMRLATCLLWVATSVPARGGDADEGSAAAEAPRAASPGGVAGQQGGMSTGIESEGAGRGEPATRNEASREGAAPTGTDRQQAAEAHTDWDWNAERFLQETWTQP